MSQSKRVFSWAATENRKYFLVSNYGSDGKASSFSSLLTELAHVICSLFFSSYVSTTRPTATSTPPLVPTCSEAEVTPTSTGVRRSDDVASRADADDSSGHAMRVSALAKDLTTMSNESRCVEVACDARSHRRRRGMRRRQRRMLAVVGVGVAGLRRRVDARRSIISALATTLSRKRVSGFASKLSFRI